MLALGAAVIGFRSAPKDGTGVSGGETPATVQFRSIAKRTAGASSYTETITLSGPHVPPGEVETSIYNAPNRLEILEPHTNEVLMIEVGNTDYSKGTFGPGWSKLSVPARAEARRSSTGTLASLVHASDVRRDGETFVVQSSGKTAGPHPVPFRISTMVWTKNGRFATMRLVESTSDPTWNGQVATVRFSKFDQSPTIRVPAGAHIATTPTIRSCLGSGCPAVDEQP